MPDLPKKIVPVPPSTQWQRDNKERYNQRQKEYMRRYRARKKAEKEQAEKGD